MSPRPVANSGRDNLGNYLILPFFTGCLAYFLAYQMRPAEEMRQGREAEAPTCVPPPRPQLALQQLLSRFLTTGSIKPTKGTVTHGDALEQGVL